ncbi:LysR family transcriptional regulator [Actinacidiphila rubida]|uniref:Regulatory helix-turn-helix protein, lysR family n=1 Tax=Actinacidiphila rubida TaxID=310780 RepID=A0A1H8U8L6_9ACTN|nr:LysR family transcriptional regulator [Actinacidiphila rubida]SEO99549.1 regulatory helix-turn-helix protein, lysR family [Actinacidiphila rubida]
MSVEQLRVLAEVARTGSYTAAAQVLGYVQPAVSYQMRRLQQAVGAPLVVRVGRGLQLTEVGHVLVRHADAIFSAMRAADHEVASVVAHGGGLVRMVALSATRVTDRNLDTYYAESWLAAQGLAIAPYQEALDRRLATGAIPA